MWITGPLLLLAIWLGVDLLRARHDLDAARAGFLTVQNQVEQGNLQGAKKGLEGPAQEAHRAGRIVDGLPFFVYAHVPGVSGPVRELRGLAHAVDSVSNEVLPALLNNDVRLPTWDGRVDVQPFLTARAPLATAEAQLRAVAREVRGAPPSGIPQLARARAEVESQLTRMTRTVHEASVTAQVVPPLSGPNGPKRYFIAVQNNAEARSTGGLVGAYAIMTLDRGRLHLEHVGSDAELVDPPQPVIQLGDEYDQRYGRLQSTRTWRSANVSPDVPTVGRLLSALWRQQTGQPLDGVALVDPVGLARLLVATGPVTLSDGTRLNESNAARYLMSDVYARFPHASQEPRKAYLAETAKLVFTALSTQHLDGRTVVRQFAKAAMTGHLQLWAADPTVQKTLLSSRIGGQLAADGPFLSVVTNDVGGSKLDYYQHRLVTYTGRSTGIATDLGTGPLLEEDATVTITLDNEAPSQVADYVALRSDAPGAPRGQANTYLSVYLGARATLLSATLDGKPVGTESATEQGLSVYALTLTIDRGQSRTLVLHVRQPAWPDQPLVYRQQPLIRDDTVRVSRPGSPVPVTYAYAAAG